MQLTSLVISLDDQLQKFVGEIVSECGHGSLEFIEINVAAPILIKGPEALAPVFNVLPKARKLGKGNKSGIVYASRGNT
jgi:hypothetical protein